MVTGGFRTRAAPEQALAYGSSDLIGLARPLCVAPDAPRQLLTGAGRLNRCEDHLSLLPRGLAFLHAIPLMRTLAAFGAIYWFHAQIDHLARTGIARPELWVFRAMIGGVAQERKLLRAP